MHTQNKAPAGSGAAMLYTRPHYNRTRNALNSQFNKALLPAPVAILSRIGIKPKAANNAGYWLMRCPFHKGGEEKNASLSMHQVNGNFRCFACGAHGGDVLAFWMQVTGRPFKQAAQELGAWEVKHGL